MKGRDWLVIYLLGIGLICNGIGDGGKGRRITALTRRVTALEQQTVELKQTLRIEREVHAYRVSKYNEMVVTVNMVNKYYNGHDPFITADFDIDSMIDCYGCHGEERWVK
jgi:hypothetical protein